jgi:hypothetical protein
MPGSAPRFLLIITALVALFGMGAVAHAEQPPRWQGPSALQVNAPGRGLLSPGLARTWGLSYVADDAYAGPWASSPLAPTAPYAAPQRAFVTPLDRSPARAANETSQPAEPKARTAESVLSRLGPISMLASILVPAIMTSSGAPNRLTRNDTTPRVSFARLGRGYGVVLMGSFH